MNLINFAILKCGSNCGSFLALERFGAVSVPEVPRDLFQVSAFWICEFLSYLVPGIRPVFGLRRPERLAVDGYIELAPGTMEMTLGFVSSSSGVAGFEERRPAARFESSTGSKPIFVAD